MLNNWQKDERTEFIINMAQTKKRIIFLLEVFNYILYHAFGYMVTMKIFNNAGKPIYVLTAMCDLTQFAI